MSYLDTRDLLDELVNLTGDDDAEVIAELSDDERARVKALRDLLDEIGEEASYGVTLIPVEDFEDYARELAEDIGAIDRNASWPLGCIDWAQAAAELTSDYSLVVFDGTDYYYRA